jgi:hypothetical protein
MMKNETKDNDLHCHTTDLRGRGGVGLGEGVGLGRVGVGTNWMKQSHLFMPPLFEIEHCSRLRAEPNSLAYL